MLFKKTTTNIILILLSTQLLSAISHIDSKIEKEQDLQVLEYFKKVTFKNKRVKIKELKITEKREIKNTDWTTIFVYMSILEKEKKLNGTKIVFNKGNIYTGDLYDTKIGRNYKDILKPNIPKEMYNKAHLLFGNKNAENKILVFTDPLCGYCKEEIPDILEFARKHPNKLAVYYYHYPLIKLHPLSKFIVKFIHEAQKNKRADVIRKIYISNRINPLKTTPQEIIKIAKDEFGYETTVQQVTTQENAIAIQSDIHMARKMMINSTPTIFVNGEWDRTRQKYKKITESKKEKNE